MPAKSLLLALLAASGLLFLAACAPQPAAEPVADSVDPFIGRWALFVPNGASWIEVKQTDGVLGADMLWYGGSVVPVANVSFRNGVLTVARTEARRSQEEPERIVTTTNLYSFVVDGDSLSGEAIAPGGEVVSFKGARIPDMPAPPDLSAVTYGDPIQLLNGTDLTGWTLTNPDAVNGWSVEDGVLVNNPVQHEGQPHVSYGNLRTEATFEDFNLKIEVSIPKGSNSGIYLRGIYEVQVADSYGLPLDPHNMGGIYSRVSPTVAAEKPAGEWQSLDITLCDRHATVILNGTTIIDNQPLYGVTGGALTADQFAPGPIYLQGDHGTVSYRNIVLTPIQK